MITYDDDDVTVSEENTQLGVQCSFFFRFVRTLTLPVKPNDTYLKIVQKSPFYDKIS